MATVAVPDSTSTLLLDVDTNLPSKAVWIQNFNTTAGLYFKPFINGQISASATASADDVFLPPAASATQPTIFCTDNGALVAARWYGFQNSGGSLNFKVFRW